MILTIVKWFKAFISIAFYLCMIGLGVLVVAQIALTFGMGWGIGCLVAMVSACWATAHVAGDSES